MSNVKLTLPKLPEGYRWVREISERFEYHILRVQKEIETTYRAPVERGWWRTLFPGSGPQPYTTETTKQWRNSYGEKVWPLDTEEMTQDTWEAQVELIAKTMLDKVIRDLENKVKIQRLLVAIEDANDA